MRSQPLPEPPPSNAPGSWHCLQLYENDAFLVKTVSHFIAKGLQAGEGLVVIATEAHREALERQLTEDVVEFDQARRCGQYVHLDANETLTRFMVAGSADLELVNTGNRCAVQPANGKHCWLASYDVRINGNFQLQGSGGPDGSPIEIHTNSDGVHGIVLKP